ncbi:MAG TPA: hypothetical protein VFR94_16830 [Nitrososphaeraceae archaeon]|nr:hypothetical protein [Nitrososphaeraceae archaeon]
MTIPDKTKLKKDIITKAGTVTIGADYSIIDTSGIHVNAIAPGVIATGIIKRQMLEDKGKNPPPTTAPIELGLSIITLLSTVYTAILLAVNLTVYLYIG